MLLEIFTNICMSMVMFIRGTPSEEKINRNIKVLNGTQWFKQIYSTNEEKFKHDENLRYIVGSAKVEKSLKSMKRTEKLRQSIMEAINDR
jgi:hypothetical protein